jgi:hypothetical protein
MTMRRHQMPKSVDFLNPAVKKAAKLSVKS